MNFAGDKKISSDPFSEQTEEQMAVQKELMGSLHDTFISFVKERRGKALVDPETADVFSGRVWTGADALKIGLIDHVGTLHEVCSSTLDSFFFVCWKFSLFQTNQ